MSRKMIRFTLTAALFGLVSLGAMQAQAGYARIVTPGISRSWEPDAVGYNGKMQGAPWRTLPFNNTNLVDVLKRSMVGSFRYPGGTIANYWDWTNGLMYGDPGDYKTSNFKIAYDAMGFSPVYVVNMLTPSANTPSQRLTAALNGLAVAQSQGLPIEYVELGNEFYLSDVDYVNEFPSGVSYGQMCQTWIAAIKAQFPGVKCAIVVTMEDRTRSNTWTAEVLANCSNYDAMIVHWYCQSALEPCVVTGDGTSAEQNTQWTAFNASNGVATMLAQPITDWSAMTGGALNLPTNANIWVTEFNLKDSNGGVRQTWAQGIFNANQVHALLKDGRVSRLYFHNWLSTNKQGIFGEATELNYVLTPHGQGSLATTPYHFGAAGQVVRLFAEVADCATAIAPLNIEYTPKVAGAGMPYDAVYGWRFTESGTNRAILVNTSSSNIDVNVAGIVSSASNMRQLYGNPFRYVTGENTTLTRGFSADTPAVLTLPAYSVTTIGGPAEPAPTGTSPNAPVFTANPIVKPATAAYVYYEQSLTNNATDADGDKLSFKKISGPTWLTVWSNGKISGTAANSDVGLNQIVVQVSDPAGRTAQSTVQITVSTGTPPSPPAIGPQSYYSAGDTFVYNGAQADVVQTLDDLLDIRSTASATFSRVPYIKFNVDQLAGTVTSAVLNVYSVDLAASVTVYSTSPNWSPATITWNNRPAFGNVVTTKVVAVGWNQINLGGLITTTGTYSFAINEGSNASRYYLSSSRGLNPPYITLSFGGGAPANNVPVFTADPISKAGATEDAAYSGTIAGSATDADGDTLTYSAQSGPSWLSIATGGALSGTPANSDVGANSWQVQVSDGKGGTDTATLNITVANVNDAPVFTVDPISKTAATEDSAYTGQTLAGSATDVDAGATLTYSKVSGPAWLTVAANGALSGTPVNADNGANSWTVQVSDGTATDTAVLNITVNAVNDAPVFTADPINQTAATEDVAYSATIAGSATDEEGAALTYSKVSGPAWLIVAANGALSGTPANGDVGTIPATVQVSDGSLTDTATLNITVNNVNDAPVFTVDPMSRANATAGTAYTGQTLSGSATDVDAGASLTYSKVSGPAWLSIATSGALTGTPASTNAGANSWTVQVSDGLGGTDTAVLNITVNAASTNAPTFVAAGAIAGGTATIAPALPSGLAAGDILLLFVETANQAVSISNTNGGTWAAVATAQGTGTAGGTSATRLTAFWSRYNGTQGAPTVSDSGDHQIARMIAIRGAATSGNPWDVTAGGVEATSDTSASIPGATTTVANTLVVVAVAGSLPDSTSTAIFSGWANANLTSLTERTDNANTSGNGGALGVATGVKAAAGACGNTTVTHASAAVKGMMSIAIKN